MHFWFNSVRTVHQQVCEPVFSRHSAQNLRAVQQPIRCESGMLLFAKDFDGVEASRLSLRIAFEPEGPK